MKWLEISVNTSPERLDEVCERLEELGAGGLIIEDEAEYMSFLENNRQYWDYIDEELRRSIAGVSRVRFYLEASMSGRAELERIKNALPEENFSCVTVRDEDWENNWKQYYKPIEVGERLLIVPEWEEAPETGERRIIRLNPGLIFGTGGHATTRMCLEELENCCEGKSVLDLGCGSGILSIAAILLGAERAVGCDIDPKAPDVARENAAMNGIDADRYTVFAGDVISDREFKRKIKGERYGVVLANIVADVIIALSEHVGDFLNDDGTFICSGIIDGRQDEVERTLTAAGIEVVGRRCEDGSWHCFRCRRRKNG